MGCICSCIKPQVPLQIPDQVHSEKNLQTEIPNDQFINYSHQQLRDHIFINQEKGSRAIKQNLKVEDNRVKYKYYREALNNSFIKADVSLKEILKNLYSKFRNLRTRIILQQRSDAYLDQPILDENIIKYFIFFFTANQVYKNYLDKQIRRKKFEQIAQIVKILRPHIAQQINIQLRDEWLFQSNYLIYKQYSGMSDQTIQDYYNMKPGKINYFPNFQIVELKENINRKNAWLTIKVDLAIPHQYLAVKPPFCKNGEKKLILFPFFCYQKQNQKPNEVVHIKNNTKINVKLRQILPKK